MSGRFTRRMYDNCAFQQNTKQSTDPLDFNIDVTKYVNCQNLCGPTGNYVEDAALLVDIESSLWGIDKISSTCDMSKYPFCGPLGCMLTNDPRIGPHITPYACERGKNGDNAVITTNMKMPTNPGFRAPNPNVCYANGNGYYITPQQHQANRQNYRQNQNLNN